MTTLTLDTIALVRAMRLDDAGAFDAVANGLTPDEQRIVFRHVCRLAGHLAEQAFGVLTEHVFDAVIWQESDA